MRQPGITIACMVIILLLAFASPTLRTEAQWKTELSQITNSWDEAWKDLDQRIKASQKKHIN